MAIVYLAEDLRHHRKVAVKVLRAELAAALGPDRFLQEIEIAARLQHPHILPLYDSGNADGFLFYVMPFVEGQSLRAKLMREGELPLGEATRILRDVADALAHAHDRNVVHRDIKPDNVMLSGGRRGLSIQPTEALREEWEAVRTRRPRARDPVTGPFVVHPQPPLLPPGSGRSPIG